MHLFKVQSEYHHCRKSPVVNGDQRGYEEYYNISGVLTVLKTTIHPLDCPGQVSICPGGNLFQLWPSGGKQHFCQLLFVYIFAVINSE